MPDHLPILEFDPDPIGMFDPGGRPPDGDVPAAAVACYFADLVNEARSDADTVLRLPSGISLLRVVHNGHRLGLFYPGQGAPLAAASLERVIAVGCSAVVGCGDAGTLTGDPLGSLTVVGSAVRDEGTSYHYLPPSREVEAAPDTVNLLLAAAEETGWNVAVGKTWTTDGLFRETRRKIERRRAEGCSVVEMEAAALLAVASFRRVRFGQYLYAGDDLSGPEWQDRGRLNASDIRRRLLDLSLDAALRLADETRRRS